MNGAAGADGPTAIALLFVWFFGLLFIPSGLYYLRTGRLVATGLKHPQPRFYGPRTFPRHLKKSDFYTHIYHGPQVRRHGLWLVSLGGVILIVFVAVGIHFLLTASDTSAVLLLAVGMLLELPLIRYFATPADEYELERLKHERQLRLYDERDMDDSQK